MLSTTGKWNHCWDREGRKPYERTSHSGCKNPEMQSSFSFQIAILCSRKLQHLRRRLQGVSLTRDPCHAPVCFCHRSQSSTSDILTATLCGLLELPMNPHPLHALPFTAIHRLDTTILKLKLNESYTHKKIPDCIQTEEIRTSSI